MHKSRGGLNVLILLFIMLAITGAAVLQWKPLPFINPGSRRLLKTGAGNYYFYRSLPEKSMLVDVSGLSYVEIRAIAKTKVKNPYFILKYAGKRKVEELKVFSVSQEYQVYQPVRIDIPEGVKQLELICYNRNIYFRVFKPFTPQPKKTKVPALQILSRNKTYNLQNNKTSSVYYSFNPDTDFTFQINKGKAFTLYVRANLEDETIPVFALYENGKMINQYTLTGKQTNTYYAEGLTHLTIGKKLEFPSADKITRYELKAVTPHTFIAKVVLRKEN
ncbi:MAG: hypothetical protein ACE14O_03610 [Candidatus Cloacimonadaceae bacterium]